MAVTAKVASAYVDLVARTEAFSKAMNEATALTKKCSAEMRASMNEAKGSIALLGEEVGVAMPRHLRTFVAGLPGVASAMSAAFDAVAVIALADFVYKAGEKVMEFAKKNEEAGRKNKEAWQSAIGPIADTNDKLELTKTKLENAIAKLEHKPQNKIKEAIEEATVAADELGRRLDADVKKISDTLKGEEHNWASQMILHQTGGNAASEISANTRDKFNQISAGTYKGSGDQTLDRDKVIKDALDEAFLRLGPATQLRDRIAAGFGGKAPSNSSSAEEVRTLTELIAGLKGMQTTSSLTQGINADQVVKGGIEGKAEAAAQAKSDAEKLIATWRNNLTAIHAVHLMSLDEDADYWQKLADSPKNSAAARADALIEANKDRAESTKAYSQHLFAGWTGDNADASRQNQESDRIHEAIMGQWDASQKADEETTAKLEKAAREIFENAAAQIEASEKIGEAAIRMQQARGDLSSAAAAAALQLLHDSSNDKYQAAVQTAGDAGASPNLKQVDRHNQEANIQAMQDSLAVFDHTWTGMVDGIFDEIIRKGDETQQALERIAIQTIDSINGELAKGMTGNKMDFSKIFESASQGMAKSALEKIEGIGLKALGLGGTHQKADGYHMWLDNLPNMPGAMGGGKNGSLPLESAGAKGLLGLLNDSNWASSLFGGRVFGAGSIFGGGHALGGAVAAGVPIDVGELGRERFTPMVPGRITSNRDMGSNAPTIGYIDARGTDPALTRENFTRALQATHARAVSDAGRAMAEHSRRVPH